MAVQQTHHTIPMFKAQTLILAALATQLASLTSIAQVHSESDNPRESTTPATQKVLEAAKAGMIDLGKAYPQKPWLLVHRHDDKNENYVFLDQTNQPLAVDYLTAGLRQKPLVSGSLVNFVFDKSIAAWNTETKTFKVQDFGDEIGAALVQKKKLYIQSFQNENLICNLYEIDLESLSKRAILGGDPKDNPYICDRKTRLVYADNKSLWSLWGHGSSGGLTVYHDSFDLKTGKKLTNVTLEKDYQQGHLMSSVVDFTQELPTKQNKHAEIYRCEFKQATRCPLRESKFAQKVDDSGNRVLEQYLPYSIDKNIPYVIHPKNLSSAPRQNYLKCGNFEYNESRKVGDRLLFKARPLEKQGMQNISKDDLDCVQ